MVASVLCHQIGQAKSGNQCEFHGSMAISYRHGKAFNLQHNLHTSYDLRSGTGSIRSRQNKSPQRPQSQKVGDKAQKSSVKKVFCKSPKSNEGRPVKGPLSPGHAPSCDYDGPPSINHGKGSGGQYYRVYKTLLSKTEISIHFADYNDVWCSYSVK